jgi:hypothetical protein
MAYAASINNNVDSLLAEILIFSLRVFQAPLISTSSSKFSKAENLFEILTLHYSLPLPPDTESSCEYIKWTDGPPAGVLGMGLTTPHHKKTVCYKILCRASGLDGFFGTT